MDLYGLKICDTCRRAQAWLSDHKIEYNFHDVRLSPVSEAQLRRWYQQVGEVLLNKRSTTWRNLDDDQRARADSDIPGLLHEQPTLMKRPVLVLDDQVLVGFSEEKYQEIAEL